MCLGNDLPGTKHWFTNGDHVAVAQVPDVTTYTSVAWQGFVRAPAAMPVGTAWRVVWLVNEQEVGGHTLTPGVDFPVTTSPLDVSQLSGDIDVRFKLVFSGVPSTLYEVELPAFYIDALTMSVDAGPVLLTNAYPDPNEQRCARSERYSIAFADVRGTAWGIDENTINVFLDGVPMVLGGGSGGQSVVYVDSFPDQQKGRSWTPLVPLDSDRTYTLSYNVLTMDGVFFEGAYTFKTRDETAPQLVAAQALTDRVVRLTFSEPMRREGDGATADMETATGYVLEAEGAPAFVPTAVSAVAVSSTSVDVTFSAELSPGIPYRVFASGPTDVWGNVVLAPYNTALFTAVYPTQPQGRAWDLFSWYADLNKREDAANTGDLAKFTSCLQELAVLLLADVDRWTEILDPDLAPEWAVDRMLADLGNPFRFDLALNDKRRLVQLLVPLYRQKGTDPGIINALRFFLGIEATIERYVSSGFELGEAELGTVGDLAWELGPGSSAAIYSFDVGIVVYLTPTQRKQLRDVVNYMKPAWTHFITLREPEVPTVVDHVELGLSELADQFELHLQGTRPWRIALTGSSSRR